jgi:hypothetical protein
MATTTATITLSSADLLSDNLSLSSTTTLYDDGYYQWYYTNEDG